MESSLSYHAFVTRYLLILSKTIVLDRYPIFHSLTHIDYLKTSTCMQKGVNEDSHINFRVCSLIISNAEFQ